MKIHSYKQLRIICVLGVAACFGLTGCKGVSSWKMPKMSWNREPSATTLAGSETPKLPESPANKYSPSTIASVGAGTSPGTSSGNKTQTYGYGQTPSATSPTSTGLAATANGYQNSPYTIGQKSNSGAQSATSAAGSVASSNANPYGGSYNGVGGAKTQDNSKTTFAGYPTPGAPANATPNTQSPYGTTPPAANNSNLGAQPAGSAYASNQYAMPPLPQTATTGSAAPSNSYQGLPPIPGAAGSSTYSLPAPSAGVGYGSTPGNSNNFAGPVPPQSSPVPSASPNPPAASPYVTDAPSNRYSGVYQPGTTGRNTTYNFGGAPTVGAAAPTTTSLPPNTASGAGPGLPTSSTLR